jgi:hypothetical protein
MIANKNEFFMERSEGSVEEKPSFRDQDNCKDLWSKTLKILTILVILQLFDQTLNFLTILVIL